MPELPEVETVRSGLAPFMEGKMITKVCLNRPNLRFPFPDNFKRHLEGESISSLGRRAKYLLMDMESGMVVIMHLGMSGSFRVESNEKAELPTSFYHDHGKHEKHNHVIFHLNDGTRIIYNDPRRFGFMDLHPRITLNTCKHFAQMGIEPTGNALSAGYLASCFSGKKTPLKIALLDQRIIAGLGNIYVCEALWRAGLSPKRACGTLVTKNGKPTKACDHLRNFICDVIHDAIKAGGSSLKDYVHTDGSLGYFQHSFAVYDRQGQNCRTEECKGTIERIKQSGRSSFYCPTCQK